VRPVRTIGAGVVLVFVSISVAACGSNEVCSPYQARGLGKAQALRGEPMDTTLGGRCGESASDVQAGYREGMQQRCNTDGAQREGYNAGIAGAAAAYGLPASYSVCGDTRPFQQAYAAGYGQGIRVFCDGTAAGAYQAGYAQGAYGQPKVPQPLPPQCARDQVDRSVAEYNRGHDAGLGVFCTNDAAAARGTDDGRAGRQPADMSRVFAACEPAVAKKLAKVYASARKAGLGSHCAGARITAAAEAAAKDGAAESSMPYEFAVCEGRAAADYDAAFAKARNRYMASYCTYERGAQTGRGHARTTNEKQLAMPAFCDRAKFADYTKGYKAGWKEGKAALCSEVDATARGVEDGKAARPLSYTAPPLCPAELHKGLLAAYRSGHASVPKPVQPTVVVVQAPPPPPPPTTTTINWSTNAKSQRGAVGQRFTFVCPKGKPEKVWGSDVYSDGSSVCSAAVHAGAIKRRGGTVTIEMRPGLSSYYGSNRHGVPSMSFGEWEGSFVVLGATNNDSSDDAVVVVALPTDPLEAARVACLDAGYSMGSCRNVTSVVCMRKGYSPSSCELPKRNLIAVEVCLDSGYSPSSCRDVTVAMCIQKGYGPATCNLPTRHLEAVEACLTAGYSPSSCRDVVDAECMRRGNIPSNCTRAGTQQVAATPPRPSADDDDDDDDDHGDSKALYNKCVTWADERYRRGMMPVDARDKANANCKKVRDLELAEYVYESASKGAMPGDAMDLALDAGRKSVGRKLDVLKYIVEKYSKGMMPLDAVKRGLTNLETLSRKARPCLESNYDAYSRGTTPPDAMDRAIQACKK
jgi:hypothetical protein